MPWPQDPFLPVANTPAPKRRGPLGAIGAGLLFCVATVAVVQFFRPSDSNPASPFSRISEAFSPSPAPGTASPRTDAFGNSHSVNVHFSMPNQDVDFPMDRNGDAANLQYEWIRFGDSTAAEPPRKLTGAKLVAPPRPGFYHLSVVNGLDRELIEQPALGVIVPFDQKVAGRLNGYNIGTYIAERAGRDDHERPDGFVEVRPEVLDLQVSKHLKLADFVTHDEQGDVWPKYVVLNRRLLDKLELVMTDLGANVRPEMAIDVHSGFRTPQHNARIPRAAEDSRHQYGDAADITIDADGDGKITQTDELLVMLSVERVEGLHPDLVGGLGLYMGKRFPVPYLHIDVRGKRTRWKG